MPNLRPYQANAVAATLEKLRAACRPILSLPTGAGKSVCATSVADMFLHHYPNARVLFLAHRKELVVQLAGHLERNGMRTGIIKSGYPRIPELPVQVASIQTLARRELPPADLLIWDECHHVMADNFKKIADAYPKAVQMGLTATPWRLDGRGLGGVFSDIIATPDSRAHVLVKTINPDTGIPYLIEPKVFSVPRPALQGVHHRAGEYDRKDLARIYDKPKIVADAVEMWKKYTPGTKSLYFAVNVEHSKHIAEQFCQAGYRFEHIDNKTPPSERQRILDLLAAGAIYGVVNVELFTEGYDLPEIETIGLLRPTESMCLHFQMVGRGARPAKGRNKVVLDHAGLFYKFGRITQEMEFSLDGAPASPTTTVAGHGLRTCTNCFRMVLASRVTCPECGADLKTQRELPQHDEGELVEMAEGQAAAAIGGQAVANDPEAQDQYWRYLEEEREASKRQPGWSAWEFKKRFGRFPVAVEVDGLRMLVHPAAGEDVQQATYRKFKAEGEAKGYKAGYAAARCRALFGEKWNGHREECAA